MVDEPNWQPAEAPPWAQAQEPNWQPAEAPSWAKGQGKPEERGVLHRAAVAPVESLKESWEAVKKPFTEEEQKKKGTLAGQISTLGTTGKAALAAVGAVPAAVLSVPQSLVTTGMAKITPTGRETEEERYRELYPQVGEAFSAIGRRPGISSTGAFKTPMPDPILERTKVVPGKGREAEAGRYLEEQ